MRTNRSATRRHCDRIALARKFGATGVVSDRGDAAIERELSCSPSRVDMSRWIPVWSHADSHAHTAARGY